MKSQVRQTLTDNFISFYNRFEFVKIFKMMEMSNQRYGTLSDSICIINTKENLSDKY